LIFFLASLLIFKLSVYFSSQFEENFEEMNNVEASVSIPLASISASHGNPMTEMTTDVRTQGRSGSLAQQAQTMFSDPNTTQELGGMMKIVPSDIHVSVAVHCFCSY
jgi:transcription factor E2F3